MMAETGPNVEQQQSMQCDEREIVAASREKWSSSHHGAVAFINQIKKISNEQRSILLYSAIYEFAHFHFVPA